MRRSVVAALATAALLAIPALASASGSTASPTNPAQSVGQCPAGRILSQPEALAYWSQHPNLPKPGTLGPNGQPIVVTELCGTDFEGTAPLTLSAGAYANLDIADMSSQDLMNHGIPQPYAPKGTKAWEDWFARESALLPAMHSQMPLYLTQSTPELLDTKTSSNWSGYLNGLSSSIPFYEYAQGQFTVPSVSAVTPLPDAIGMWVGLGGWNGWSSPSQLWQSGVNSVIETNGVVDNYAFWEDVPGTASVPLFTVNTGDAVWVQTEWVTSNQYWYAIQDLTTGTQSSGFEYPNWSTQNDNSAEFVVEGNMYSPNYGSYLEIPRFSYIPMTDLYAGQIQNELPGEDLPWYAVDEISSMGDLTPTGWTSSTSFDLNYGTSSTVP